MNKELKEAKRLRKFIKEMERKNQSITYDYNYDFLQDLETVLNYIDNSIPKEVIEKKIAEQWVKCPKNSINKFAIVERNNKIDAYKELLKGK